MSKSDIPLLLGLAMLAGCSAQGAPAGATGEDASPAAGIAAAAPVKPASIGNSPAQPFPTMNTQLAGPSPRPKEVVPPARANAAPAPERTTEPVAAAQAVARPAAFVQCIACHSVERGEGSGIGPNLFGVFGSPAGSRQGFAYSDGMKEAGFVWSDSKLDEFLRAPQSVVPGTTMAFFGEPDEESRKKIISYLRSLG